MAQQNFDENFNALLIDPANLIPNALYLLGTGVTAVKFCFGNASDQDVVNYLDACFHHLGTVYDLQIDQVQGRGPLAQQVRQRLLQALQVGLVGAAIGAVVGILVLGPLAIPKATLVGLGLGLLVGLVGWRIKLSVYRYGGDKFAKLEAIPA